MGKLSDPYSWAGKMGVDSGSIPLSRWRGNLVNVSVQGDAADEARTSDNRVSDDQLRPETRPVPKTNKTRGAKKK